MNEPKLQHLLRDVRAEKTSVDSAVRQLKSLAIHNLDFARVDGHRALRKGFPEVIYCEGKTPAQDRLCQLGGTKVALADATLRQLYRSRADYQDRVNKRLDVLVKDGWFLPEYVDDVRTDAAAVKIP